MTDPAALPTVRPADALDRLMADLHQRLAAGQRFIRIGQIFDLVGAHAEAAAAAAATHRPEAT